jgi:hypothetical protein
MIHSNDRALKECCTRHGLLHGLGEVCGCPTERHVQRQVTANVRGESVMAICVNECKNLISRTSVDIRLKVLIVMVA